MKMSGPVAAVTPSLTPAPEKVLPSLIVEPGPVAHDVDGDGGDSSGHRGIVHGPGLHCVSADLRESDDATSVRTQHNADLEHQCRDGSIETLITSTDTLRSRSVAPSVEFDCIDSGCRSCEGEPCGLEQLLRRGTNDPTSRPSSRTTFEPIAPVALTHYSAAAAAKIAPAKAPFSRTTTAAGGVVSPSAGLLGPSLQVTLAEVLVDCSVEAVGEIVSSELLLTSVTRCSPVDIFSSGTSSPNLAPSPAVTALATSATCGGGDHRDDEDELPGLFEVTCSDTDDDDDDMSSPAVAGGAPTFASTMVTPVTSPCHRDDYKSDHRLLVKRGRTTFMDESVGCLWCAGCEALWADLVVKYRRNSSTGKETFDGEEVVLNAM